MASKLLAAFLSAALAWPPGLARADDNNDQQAYIAAKQALRNTVLSSGGNVTQFQQQMAVLFTDTSRVPEARSFVENIRTVALVETVAGTPSSINPGKLQAVLDGITHSANQGTLPPVVSQAITGRVIVPNSQMQVNLLQVLNDQGGPIHGQGLPPEVHGPLATSLDALRQHFPDGVNETRASESGPGNTTASPVHGAPTSLTSPNNPQGVPVARTQSTIAGVSASIKKPGQNGIFAEGSSGNNAESLRGVQLAAVGLPWDHLIRPPQTGSPPELRETSPLSEASIPSPWAYVAPLFPAFITTATGFGLAGNLWHAFYVPGSHEEGGTSHLTTALALMLVGVQPGGLPGNGPPGEDEARQFQRPKSQQELLERLQGMRGLDADTKALLTQIIAGLHMHETALDGALGQLTRGDFDLLSDRRTVEYFLLLGDMDSAVLVLKAANGTLTQSEQEALDKALAPILAKRNELRPQIEQGRRDHERKQRDAALADRLKEISGRLKGRSQTLTDEDIAALRRMSPEGIRTLQEAGHLDQDQAAHLTQVLALLTGPDGKPVSGQDLALLQAFSFDTHLVGLWNRVEELNEQEEKDLLNAVMRGLIPKLQALRSQGNAADPELLQQLEGMAASFRQHRQQYALDAAQKIPVIANPVARELARYQLARSQLELELALETDPAKRGDLRGRLAQLDQRYEKYEPALWKPGQDFLKRMEEERASIEANLLRPAVQLRAQLAALQIAGNQADPDALARVRAELARVNGLLSDRIQSLTREWDNKGRHGIPIYQNDTYRWLVAGLTEVRDNLYKPPLSGPAPAAVLARLENLRLSLREMGLNDEERRRVQAGLIEPTLALLGPSLPKSQLPQDLRPRSQDARISAYFPDYARLLGQLARGEISPADARQQLLVLNANVNNVMSDEGKADRFGLPKTEMLATPQTLVLLGQLRQAAEAWLEPPPDALGRTLLVLTQGVPLLGNTDPGLLQARQMVLLYAGRIPDGRSYSPAQLGLGGVYAEGTQLVKRTLADPSGQAHQGLVIIRPGAQAGAPTAFESFDGKFRIIIVLGPDNQPRYEDKVTINGEDRQLVRRNLSPSPDEPWNVLYGRLSPEGRIVPRALEFFIVDAKGQPVLDGKGQPQRKSLQVLVAGVFNADRVTTTELQDEETRRRNTISIGVAPDTSTPPRQRSLEAQLAEARQAALLILSMSPDLAKYGKTDADALARAIFLSDRVGSRDMSVIAPNGGAAHILSKSLSVQGEWIIIANRLEGGIVRYDTYRFEKASSYGGQENGDALVRYLPVYNIPPELRGRAGLWMNGSTNAEQGRAYIYQQLDLRDPAGFAQAPRNRKPLPKDENNQPVSEIHLAGNGRATEYLASGTDLEWRRSEYYQGKFNIEMLWSNTTREADLYLHSVSWGGNWTQLAALGKSEHQEHYSQEIPSSSILGAVSAAVHEAPVVGHALKGLGWVGEKGTQFVLGGLNVVGGEVLPGEGSVHGPAYLERMIGSDPKDPAVVARVGSFYAGHPEAREALDLYVRTQRLLDIQQLMQQNRWTPQSFPGLGKFGPGRSGFDAMAEDAKTRPVTDQDRADTLLRNPYLTTRGVARSWSERGAATGNWGWNVGAVSLHLGEGYLNALPTMLALGAFGRLGGAAASMETRYALLNAGLDTVATSSALMSAYVQTTWALDATTAGIQAVDLTMRGGNAAERDAKWGESLLNAGLLLGPHLLPEHRPSLTQLGTERVRLDAQISAFEAERAQLKRLADEGNATRADARRMDYLDERLGELTGRREQVWLAMAQLRLQQARTGQGAPEPPVSAPPAGGKSFAQTLGNLWAQYGHSQGLFYRLSFGFFGIVPESFGNGKVIIEKLPFDKYMNIGVHPGTPREILSGLKDLTARADAEGWNLQGITNNQSLIKFAQKHGWDVQPLSEASLGTRIKAWLQSPSSALGDLFGIRGGAQGEYFVMTRDSPQTRAAENAARTKAAIDAAVNEMFNLPANFTGPKPNFTRHFPGIEPLPADPAARQASIAARVRAQLGLPESQRLTVRVLGDGASGDQVFLVLGDGGTVAVAKVYTPDSAPRLMLELGNIQTLGSLGMGDKVKLTEPLGVFRENTGDAPKVLYLMKPAEGQSAADFLSALARAGTPEARQGALDQVLRTMAGPAGEGLGTLARSSLGGPLTRAAKTDMVETAQGKLKALGEQVRQRFQQGKIDQQTYDNFVRLHEHLTRTMEQQGAAFIENGGQATSASHGDSHVFNWFIKDGNLTAIDLDWAKGKGDSPGHDLARFLESINVYNQVKGWNLTQAELGRINDAVLRAYAQASGLSVESLQPDIAFMRTRYQVTSLRIASESSNPNQLKQVQQSLYHYWNLSSN